MHFFTRFSYYRAKRTGHDYPLVQAGKGLAIATVITIAVAVGLARLANFTYFYLAGSVIMLGIWVIVVAMATYLKRKFSGLAGNTYGAINEVAEVDVLILVCLLAHNRWFS